MVSVEKNEARKFYAQGTVYIRWGRESCPTQSGAMLIYEGIVGGGWFQTSGVLG